jgi:deoxyadenosine/deoxycytidine kinase
MSGTIISLFGIIGSGKSTVAKKLSATIPNSKLYTENVNGNKILPFFYKDMKKYAFHMEINTMLLREHTRNQIDNASGKCISDRSIYEDKIFIDLMYESKFLTKLEYETCNDMFESIVSRHKWPDIIIYVDCKPEVALERIKKRARNYEKEITLEYMKNLYKKYNDHIKKLKEKCPILRIDFSENIPDINSQNLESVALLLKDFMRI